MAEAAHLVLFALARATAAGKVLSIKKKLLDFVAWLATLSSPLSLPLPTLLPLRQALTDVVMAFVDREFCDLSIWVKAAFKLHSKCNFICSQS